MRMRPSAREHLSANVTHQHVAEQYVNSLMSQLLQTYRTTTLIDDVWVDGMENRKVFAQLDPIHQNAVANLDTIAAQCFLNGVYGRGWNYGLDGLP